jgi:hypothetical protein
MSGISVIRDHIRTTTANPPKQLAPIIEWVRKHPAAAVVLMSGVSTMIGVTADKIVRALIPRER